MACSMMLTSIDLGSLSDLASIMDYWDFRELITNMQ